MNLIKAGLRVKLGLSNPYQIRPQYKLFTKPQNNRIIGKIVSKSKVGNDYHFIRVNLPMGSQAKNKCLGLKLGQYIWVQLKGGQKRPYVPISAIDQPNFIDLLVRDMSGKNIGSFTEKLLNLPMQSQVMIEGPGTQFQYEGFGKFKYIDPLNMEVKIKKFKNIGIITHSSAITTSYSLIQSIAMNYDNETGVSLLWLGDHQSDFMLLNQLLTYTEQCKLNMNLMLTSFQKDWPGPYGKLTQSHITDFMPPPGSKQIIIMSGLEGEFTYIPKIVQKMGYKDYLNF